MELLPFGANSSQLFFVFFTVKILDVNRLPCEGELGTDSYTCVSLVRGTSLKALAPSQELKLPSSITYVGESAQLSRYEDIGEEPLIKRDGVPLYHTLHRNFDCYDDLPTMGKRMLAKMSLH
ncbi:hypothetical protein AMTR_s00015p00237170 [Amborella trichopoda]|uniref:Uncharacterized protein n=1 Tax=Amborella trichopoda TaxID=13333 RepID=W1PP10_AMBTC|nr:hypothetical protein AMTR_s00015p00237170 [Amborella trichopoda]